MKPNLWACFFFFFFSFFNIQCQGSYKSKHTEHITRGAGDRRDGRGKHKTVGNRHMRRSVEGSRMGRGKEDEHYTFRKESKEFEGGGFGVD